MAANKRIRSRRSRTGTELAREARATGPQVIKARKQDLDRWNGTPRRFAMPVAAFRCSKNAHAAAKPRS